MSCAVINCGCLGCQQERKVDDLRAARSRISDLESRLSEREQEVQHCMTGRARFMRERDAAVAELGTVNAQLAESEAGAGAMREALDQTTAALGDRLLANGPLSEPYAHAVMRQISAALSTNAGAQLLSDLETARREYQAVCEALGASDYREGQGSVFPSVDVTCSAIRDMRRQLREHDDDRILKERDSWDEDDGSVIWWTIPISEPPYVGTPLDDEFPEYATHWTRLQMPFGESVARDASGTGTGESE